MVLPPAAGNADCPFIESQVVEYGSQFVLFGGDIELFINH